MFCLLLKIVLEAGLTESNNQIVIVEKDCGYYVLINL